MRHEQIAYRELGRFLVRITYAIAALVSFLITVPALADEILTVDTRPGVKQSMLL